jgi:hypothetical protein
MKADKGWVLVLAAAAAAAGGAAVAMSWRCQHAHRIAHTAHKADIKEWENEGGNCAPDVR